MDIRRRFLGTTKKPKSEGSGTYQIELNGQWRQSTMVTNPDDTLYDGVYESFSNIGVNNSMATMTITISGYETFTLYIRSYAESGYDYVMVSQLDQTITQSTSANYTVIVKAYNNRYQSGTDIYSYTPVTFEGIDGGEHTISIVFRKDSSGSSYNDQGYVLISKDNISIDEPGEDQPDPNTIDDYLTIEALEDGLTTYLSANSCEYCIDFDQNWITLPAGSSTPSINTGHMISFRGNITPSASGIGTFNISRACNLKGNCMSMLFGDDAKTNISLEGKKYAFQRLFQNCTTIRQVSSDFLPAMVLSQYCYNYMFQGCSGMTQCPNLPALTLMSYCYQGMFYNCSSLVSSPVLAATTLASYCCYYMFYNCKTLETAPNLNALTLTTYCYYSMFSGCENLLYITMLATNVSASGCMGSWVKKVERQGGIFTKNINATWTTTGDSGVPIKWSIQYYNPETGEITT